MIWFIVVLLLIMFSSVKFSGKDQFQEDYLAKDNTNVIKGIFIFLIVLSHGVQYLDLQGPFDAAYDAVRQHLNQMVVVMFFFYSGYGLAESLKKKGFPYVKGFIKHRFLPVFINLALAIILFLIMDVIIGKSYPWNTILLAFTGYTAVGNSNWYMFAILATYLLFFVSFLLMKKNDKSKGLMAVGMAIFTILIVAFVFWQIRIGRPKYTYNTVIFVAIGGWYSLLKEHIEKLFMRKDIIWFAGIAVSVIAYALSFQKRWKGIEWYTVWAFCFFAITILLTMKVRFHSKFLQFLGEHIFPIYILQRIPMTIMDTLGFSEHKYFFMCIAFAVTLFMVLPFEKLSNLVNHKLLKLN